MERTRNDPDAFIDSLSDDVREDVGKLDEIISDQFGEESRVMWEGKLWGGTDQQIIGYGEFSYTNSRGENVEWFAVGLASQKNYISVYVNAVEDGAYLVQEFKDRLGQVKVGSASLSFPSLASLELDVFGELIRRAREST
jgi:hypothetical protein